MGPGADGTVTQAQLQAGSATVTATVLLPAATDCSLPGQPLDSDSSVSPGRARGQSVSRSRRADPDSGPELLELGIISPASQADAGELETSVTPWSGTLSQVPEFPVISRGNGSHVTSCRMRGVQGVVSAVFGLLYIVLIADDTLTSCSLICVKKVG